ncbi:hypothetical protein WJX74_002483 [Apatococcus lobatus]|uniref:Uncharacterized protein n=1 Tax=Apatococcus lobatus TaxID=904363 RepID=A0AAW1QBJ4_9CHLO
MKLTATVLAATCFANVALAVTMPLNAESLQTVLGDMFGSINAEFATSVANSAGHKRSLLQASASGSATGNGSAASSAASALGSMGTTLSGLFNHDWANEFSPDALKNLNWTQLGTWQNTTPLQDVIDNHEVSLPDFSEIEEQIQNLTSSFCTPASCTESTKEDSWDAMSTPSSYPTSASGYGSSTPAQPKAAPVCTPAQLLLVKTPGKCSLKHNTAATYTGKSCIFQKTFGFNKTEVYGGEDLLCFIHKGLEAKQHQRLLPAPMKNATAHHLRRQQ